MTVPETPADVLDAAADYIDEHGWTQGKLRRTDGCVCAVGALRAVTDTPDDRVMPILGQDALRATEISIGGGFLAAWNDAPTQTAENVTATLREVATSLRGDS